MRVHVLGDAFCDVVAQSVSGIPAWGTGTRSSGIGLFPGGSALNVAVHVKSLMGESCQVVMFTALGGDPNDWASKVLEEHLQKNNVTLRAARLQGISTGVCIVLSGHGDRAFVTSAGAVTAFSDDHLDLNELANCDHLHLGGLYSLHAMVNKLPEVVEELRKRNPNLTVSVDTNFDDTGNWGDPWLPRLLPLIDVIKQNEAEAEGVLNKQTQRSGTLFEATSYLASRVRQAGVVTLGENGALFAQRSDPKQVVEVSSFDVDLVDACGAGDAWNAGFIAHWLRNGRKDVEQAVRFACASGAVSVKSLGACQTPVDKAEVEFLLKSGTVKRPRHL